MLPSFFNSWTVHKIIEYFTLGLLSSLWNIYHSTTVYCFDPPCMYVCTWYLLDVTDAHTHQIINTKSKVRMTNNTKQKTERKLFHSTELYKQWIRKDFLWRSVEYSDQRWTWVGSIHRLGWVGSHFPAHVMGWAGLNEKYCYLFTAFCVCYNIMC